ncbi:hypothetical protein PCE1_001168 [Barthelona sp. PCE]
MFLFSTVTGILRAVGTDVEAAQFENWPRGHEHTFSSDVFSLGRTIAFIYALDRTDISSTRRPSEAVGVRAYIPRLVRGVVLRT